MTERFLLFLAVYVTFQSANRQENRRKVKQNEEKWKEAINFRNYIACNVCNLDMFNTMCGCAVGRAEGHRDLIFLGIYYVVVIFGYLIFEMIPINYRPILIEGMLEASYPSSTTLLVLSVMPTLVYQVNRRSTNLLFRRCVSVMSIIFSTFMVIGRLIAGVHWFTDIVGAVILSIGLYCLYKAMVLLF